MRKNTNIFLCFVMIIALFFSAISVTSCIGNNKVISEINYDLDGGINDFSNPISIEKEYKFNEPEKLGYDFIGWSVNGEEAVKELTLEPKKKTNYSLKAIWEASTYKVTLDYGIEGEEPEVIEVTYDSNYELPESNPKKNDFVIIGWNYYFSTIDNSGIWGIASDCTLTPIWKNKNSVITLKLNSGVLPESSSSEINVLYGAEYELPEPTRDGFTFAGWYYNNGKIANKGTWNYLDSITLEAMWLQDEYDITLNYNNGNQNSIIKIHLNDNYELVEPTRDSYRFDGWYYDDVKIDNKGIWKLIGNITLEARWISNKYEVTLDYGYDQQIETKTFMYGEPYTLPTLERDYYDFLGWYYNGTLVTSGSSWNITDDNIELKAKWAEKTVTINYVIRNLVDNDTKIEREYHMGNYFMGPSKYFVPSGRKITYWYDENGDLIDDDFVVLEEITVYADEYSDGLKFALTDDKKSYCVSEYSGTSSDVFIPNYYYGKRVVEIGDYAFYQNDSIKTVSFSNGITKIGNYAFDGSTVETLTNTVSIVDIGKYAFANSKIKSLYVVSHHSIGEYAFYNCGEFTGFTYKYGTNISINNTIKRIEPYTFYFCDKLERFEFADTLTSVGRFAFAYSGLNYFGHTSTNGILKQIGDYAFAGTKITSFNADGCEYFGDSVFKNASELSYIHLDIIIRYVGYKIFEGTSITFYTENNNKYVSNISNKYCILYEGTNNNFSSDTDIIGGGAFENNTSITKITINRRIYGIGAKAFKGCTNLATMDISSDSLLLYIGKEAFYGTKIKSLSFSYSLCSILGPIIDSNLDSVSLGKLSNETTFMVLTNNNYLIDSEFPFLSSTDLSYNEINYSDTATIKSLFKTSDYPIIFRYL